MDFRILSIDGGGFKGLYAASVLEVIENANQPLHKHFDLICGTSTGGIIALAIAAGISLTDVKQFYLQKGPSIFPPVNQPMQFFLTFKQQFLGCKYSAQPLRLALQEIFGDKRLREGNSYVCIPAVNLRNGDNVVFKTNHNSSLTRDGDLLMRDVALATSAAPTFFPVAQVTGLTGGEFIDGGLWANNPSFIGMIEAYRYFVGPDKRYKRFSILSIPSVTHETPLPINDKKNLSFLDWGEKIFQQIVNSQTKAVSKSMELLTPHLDDGSNRFIEIPSPVIRGRDATRIALDRADGESIKILVGLGEKMGHQYNKNNEVAEFFKSEKNPPTFYN